MRLEIKFSKDFAHTFNELEISGIPWDFSLNSF